MVKNYHCGELFSPALKEMLETEQKLKRNVYGNGIGFCAN